MKQIICITLLAMFYNCAYGQQNVLDFQTPDNEYLEIRHNLLKGWQYRTSPNLSFEKSGVFHQKIKPLVKENPVAFAHFKSYRKNYALMVSASMVAGTGAAFLFVGNQFEDKTMSRTGAAMLTVGFGASIMLVDKMNKNLRNSIDAYNRSKGLNPTTFQSIIPTIQPASQSAGLGLVWSIQ